MNNPVSISPYDISGQIVKIVDFDNNWHLFSWISYIKVIVWFSSFSTRGFSQITDDTPFLQQNYFLLTTSKWKISYFAILFHLGLILWIELMNRKSFYVIPLSSGDPPHPNPITRLDYLKWAHLETVKFQRSTRLRWGWRGQG